MTVDPIIAAPDPVWERLSAGTGDVYASHSRIAALLRARMGAEAGGFLAEPVLDDAGGLVGWRGPDGAALRPAPNDTVHQALIAKAEDLAAQLERQGGAGQSAAATIRAALTTPTDAPLAFVNAATGAPVMANWGMIAPGQTPPKGVAPPLACAPSAHPVPQSAAAAVGAQAMPATTAALGPNAGVRRFPLFLWLAPVALAALLVWIGLQWLTPPPTNVVEIIPPAPPAYDPSDDIRDRIAALTASLDDVRGEQPEFQSACILPDPPKPQVVVEVPPEPTREITREPEIIPDPPAPEPAETAVVVPKPLPKPTPPPRKVEPEPEVAIVTPEPTPAPSRPAPPQGSACNPTWSPGKQPRMVFVVDGSGSMEEGIRGASSRMSAVKQSIGRVVRGLHPDIRIGMVSFSDCGATSNSQYHSQSERGALLGKVNRINPAKRTSLAASIRRAGAMASRRAPTTLVIASDGEDTCGDNPCAAAQEVRRKKPNVTISVIDMSGGSARQVLNCVAQAGGGRVYLPNSAQQMADQMQRATGQPDASQCQ
jgi:outer membrane biosynthesis protein TonB